MANIGATVSRIANDLPNISVCSLISLLLPERLLPMPFAPIEQAIEDFRAGRLVIIVDDEDRENEGDLACAAEKVTPEAINFMAREGRGLICLPLTEGHCDQLRLPLQVSAHEN